jgi:phosphoribosylamine-glycine ligase
VKPAFLLYNFSGDFLGIQMRLDDEGYKTFSFYGGEITKGAENTGKGLVNIVENPMKVINEYLKNPRDLVILVDDNVQSETFLNLRRQGFPVLGCSPLSASSEHDRKKGNELADKIGITVPPTHHFTDLNQAIGFVQSKKEKFVFKPDGLKLAGSAKTYPARSGEDLLRFLQWIPEDMATNHYDIEKFELQEVINGIEVDISSWYNGKEFSNIAGVTFEQKKLQGLGSAQGCFGQVLTYIPLTDPYARFFNNLKPLIFESEPSPNQWAINAIVSHQTKEPNFLEWTPRFGWDSTFGELALLQDAEVSLGEFFTKVATGESVEKLLPIGRYSATARLFSESPGTPHEKVVGKPIWVDKSIKNDIWFYSVQKKKDSLTITGNTFAVATAVGDTPEEAVASLYTKIDPDNGLLSTPDIFYSKHIGEGVRESLTKLSEYDILEEY